MIRRPRTVGSLAVTLGVVGLLLVAAELDAGSGRDAAVREEATGVPAPAAPAPDPTPTAPGATSSTDPAVPQPSWTPVSRPVRNAPTPDGFRVAAGTGPVVGTDGPVSRYTVEVESGSGVELATVVPVVRDALEDPDRGWTAGGNLRLQWVDDPTAADVRVVVATPPTVDAHCAEAGLQTNGFYSCWDGARAMLNVDRWQSATDDFGDDLALYRTYLVNHEVGHGLGFGHVACPHPGALAPVMMQQTESVGTCRPNGWPVPETDGTLR